MRAAVLGRGAREHALARRLAEDLGLGGVLVVPGNAGIPGALGDLPEGASLADELLAREISLVVVGPEALLAEGVSDALRARGPLVVGPSKAASALETSKAFAKEFLARHHIPTARAVLLGAGEALPPLDFPSPGAVVKYDGLAEGKGVIVCTDATSVRDAVAELRARYGSHAQLVVEERLEGPELSVMLLVSDGEVVVLPDSRDHKRLEDGDHGPNTGGMGAFSPVLAEDDPRSREVREDIVGPVVRGLVKDGVDYRGFLYVGLMLTTSGPKVLEFNVRFGDPEAQVVLPRVGGNFATLCVACAEGRLAGMSVAIRDTHAVGVVLARRGYPRAAEGDPVHIPSDLVVGEQGHVCVAGALRERGDAHDDLVFTQGRSLTVVGLGATREEAREGAYARVAALARPGLVYRTDIGSSS